jgi:hypothetical protein
MNAHGVASIPPAKVARTPLEALQVALQSVEPSKRQRREDALIEAYDLLKDSHGRGVPWKTIVAKFNEAYGLVMHPARLRKDFEAERVRREHVYGVTAVEGNEDERAMASGQVNEGVKA